MRIISTLCCAALTLCVEGQSTFLRTLEFNGIVQITGSAVTHDGGLILCGWRGGSVNPGILIRLDPAGIVLWHREFQGTGVDYNGLWGANYDIVLFSDVAMLADSTYMVVGGTRSLNGQTTHDLLTARFSTSGDTLGARVYGGVDHDFYDFVEVESQGSILTGGRYSTLGGSDYGLLQRVDQNSHALMEDWRIDASEVTKAIPSLDGGALVVGFPWTCNGGYFLAKTNAALEEQWRLRFYWPSALIGDFRVAEGQDSSVYFVGGTNGNPGPYQPALLLKTTPGGTVLWQRKISAPLTPVIADMKVRPNGRLLLAGTTAGISWLDSSFAWLMEFDTSGTLVWSRRFDAVGDTILIATMELADDGSCYLIGSVALSSGTQVHVIKVDSTGQLPSCQYPPFNPTITTTTTTTPGFVCSSTTGPATGIPPNSHFEPYYVNGTSTNMLACANYGMGVIVDREFDHARVQPNPFTYATMLICTEVLGIDTRIELMDLHGRVVRTLQGNGTREVTIERGTLQSGLYMVRVLDAHGQRAAVRVVVQ